MKLCPAGVGAALVLALTAPVIPASPATATAVSGVAWTACDPEVLHPVPVSERASLSCGSVAVPVDHDVPSAGTLPLALMRRRAGDPNQRIGTLFVNIGGPGGSGFLYTRLVHERFAPSVLARFDIVGFDPRGVGRSGPVRCFTSQEQVYGLLSRSFAAPVQPAEIASSIDAADEYSRLCAANAGPLLEHLSTRDVARDLDLLRAAVGDDRLSYVGLSYGTLLGATYAALFPQRVRSIVLDGSVDPQLRTADGAQYVYQRSQGFELALNAMLTQCEGSGTRCALAPGARAKFTALREHLRTSSLKRADGSTVTFSSFVSELVSLLQQPALFDELAASLQADYEVMRTGKARSPATTGTAGETAYHGDDSYFGVNCTDMPFPDALDPAATATAWEKVSPTFGRYHAFLEPAQCPSWPSTGADRYSGPWANRSGRTILVYGNVFDPATQYRFAQRMVSQLGDARLVTVGAFGHTILGDSACTDQITAAYLVDGQVPPAGRICQPDLTPFS
ncbi:MULTISPECIES: alpha/beta fold hydrolase [unclassified Micromonospora]|uniref:alpha/beta fold hydrolase n=1 Tax=unclassified Micromonospora TaxID=2617518 RepID=UPI0022B67F99|nr:MULTISPECIES: alpha/beta fold hydrolase [unclassified Micromonospora]MCZ7421937.1 alpha/beta fold hydrolase [Verrucosispora sp. WMMA2121]WBB93328.1 alpha/beta fold hydrolase [Verrucosispora sp. WMMC514]